MSRAWMPLYVADYLGDTRRLSTLEHGAYLLLIMEYWQRGGLPDDDSRLARIAGLSLEEWMCIRSAIAELFQDGWRHKRIDAELAKSESVSEKRRESANRKWEKRKNGQSDANAHASAHAIAYAKDMHRARVPQPQSHIGDNKIDTDSGNILDLCPKPAKPVRTRNQYPEDFLKFWESYPTDANMSKAEAAKAWARLQDDDKQLATKSVGAFRAYCAAHPDYRPVHANRYLTQRRFEGHVQAAERSAAVSVVVKQGTPQGDAWECYTRVMKGKGVPWTNGTWRFPSEWPPNAKTATNNPGACARETR